MPEIKSDKKREAIRRKNKEIAERTRKGVEETFNPPADPATKFFRKILGMKSDS